MARPKSSVKRSPVTFRLRADLIKRLEEAKWGVRMTKQEVVEKALEDLFAKHDIK